MSIIITREVKEVTIVVSREGKEVIIQPVLSKNGNNEGFDGIVNGGTP